MIKLHGSENSYVGDTYLNEGISWEGLNKYKKTLDTYDTALEIYTKSNGKDSTTAAHAMNNIAWVHRRIKDYDKSNHWFRRALGI
jgi:tetratricopeptide (TPR) repeat protein